MSKFLFSAALLIGSLNSAFAIEITHPKAVVEIFTSQGCYSCPPADKLVGKFAQEGEVLGLSWHVDYWDYLGWKDTFSSKANTQRQYGYAAALKERQVYTPQAVINGRAHTTGSREAEIRKIMNYFDGDKKGMLVPIKVGMTDESLEISVAVDEVAKDATLYMVFYNNQHDVEIENGENGGKTLSYYNTVHDIQPLGMMKERGLQMDYPLTELKRRGFDASALILQKTDAAGNPGPILGAAVISDM